MLRARATAVAVPALLLVLVAPVPAADRDGDGFDPPVDCNDASAGQAPGLTEVCDGFDNDCDGLLDESPFCDGRCLILESAVGPTLPTTGGGASGDGSLAWTGSGYGLAWTEEVSGVEDVAFALLDAAGADVSGLVPVTATATSARNPALAWNGTGFGLAWVDERDGSEEIYVQALSAAGVPQGTALPLTDDPAFSGEPSLAWSGSFFVLAWTEAAGGDREIVVAVLDEEMAPVAGPFPVSSDPAVSEQPSVAWGLDGGAVAWTDERDGNREIYVRALGSAGIPSGSEIRVTSQAAVSAQPSLAWTGSGYAVAWTDERDGNREIYLRPLTAALAPTGSPMRLTSDSAISDQPVLGWSGDELAVAWRDTRVLNGEVFLARADLAGSPEGTPLRVSHDLGLASRRPALAWTGSGWTVSWDDIEISVQRVTCDCADGDGDGVSLCRDCDDGDGRVWPGAPQACDGVNNDCLAADWPLVPVDEKDGDGDSWLACADCDDGAAMVHPGATEACNGVDDDCSGVPDDLDGDLDSDGDGVPAACDLCPQVGDPGQTDLDGDGEGDMCDADDGLILLRIDESLQMGWVLEAGVDLYDLYRGDLQVLRSTGAYTQAPGGLAARGCGLSGPPWADDPPLQPGEAVHYLATAAGSNDLGADSSGAPRSNGAPCP